MRSAELINLHVIPMGDPGVYRTVLNNSPNGITSEYYRDYILLSSVIVKADDGRNVEERIIKVLDTKEYFMVYHDHMIQPHQYYHKGEFCDQRKYMKNYKLK